MNELIELTRFRESVAEDPDPDALARARNRLVKRLRKRPTGIHVLTPRRLAIATAVVVAAVGGVVVDALMIGDEPLGASAEAADLLHQAADQAIGAADPEVGPDEYLRVTTLAVYGQGYGADAVQTLETRELFVPGDPAREWVLRAAPMAPYRPEDAEVAERLGLLDPLDDGFTERARDGAFFGQPAWPSWSSPTPEFLADLTRDPEELLAQIYEDADDGGPSRDGEALVLIADILRSGIVPGDLRAALFRAAALIPGVELVDRQANLNGEVGVAVGRYEPNNGERQEIIFDPETGMVIGERDVRVDPGHPLFPAGSLVSWTAVTTDVVPAAEVDQIPANPLN
jgi:hypothetical protein